MSYDEVVRATSLLFEGIATLFLLISTFKAMSEKDYGKSITYALILISISIWNK
jgi:hypothetical protein